MTDKVKLPKEVFDALNQAKDDQEFTDAEIVARSVEKGWLFTKNKPLNDFDPDVIMKALVVGYEPEKTPEEQIKQLYHHGDKATDFFKGYKIGIRDALSTHNIKYDWMDAE